MKILAVDPGGVHVGWCELTHRVGPLTKGKEFYTWIRTGVGEWTPDQAIDEIAAGLLRREWETLVVEEFRLYPDKAMEQTGSTMPTCELIGQIKWAVRLAHRAARQEWPEQVGAELVLQPASIQTPTASLLRARGVKSEAARQKAGGHAKSAELHGCHYVIRTLGQTVV